ncbi:MAG: 4Fe-4S binding protein [Desulfobacterota bacterium]|nr:4Fe-4S binding protein [Thermodesulfobacteriota bacterium]MDW8001093.1 4Fe-4S binding protein [Deltaproteobacteria bacterium]
MAKPMESYRWYELNVGCVIDEPGNSIVYKTGDWRIMRPQTDYSKCTKCGLCWLFCPDNAMKPNEQGFFAPDLDYCKGCGICAQECKFEAIQMVEDRK